MNSFSSLCGFSWNASVLGACPWNRTILWEEAAGRVSYALSAQFAAGLVIACSEGSHPPWPERRLPVEPLRTGRISSSPCIAALAAAVPQRLPSRFEVLFFFFTQGGRVCPLQRRSYFCRWGFLRSRDGTPPLAVGGSRRTEGVLR